MSVRANDSVTCARGSYYLISRFSGTIFPSEFVDALTTDSTSGSRNYLFSFPSFSRFADGKRYENVGKEEETSIRIISTHISAGESRPLCINLHSCPGRWSSFYFSPAGRPSECDTLSFMGKSSGVSSRSKCRVRLFARSLRGATSRARFNSLTIERVYYLSG